MRACTSYSASSVVREREPWTLLADAKGSACDITAPGVVPGTAASGFAPESMELGPVEASREALDRAGITINHDRAGDCAEFTARVLAVALNMGVQEHQLDVNGCQGTASVPECRS